MRRYWVAGLHDARLLRASKEPSISNRRLERGHIARSLWKAALVDHRAAVSLQLLGNAPTLFSVETKNQRGRELVLAISLGHRFHLILQERIADPLEREFNLAIEAFHQFQTPLMRDVHPLHEFARITDRG